MTTNRLIVDGREPMDVFLAVGEFFDEYDRQILPVGDFTNSAHKFIVERKACDDFLQSLHDGRYEDQRYRMALEPCARYWIIEGLWDAWYSQLPPGVRASINAAICSLTVKYHIEILHSTTITHTIQYVKYLHEKCLEAPMPPQIRNNAKDSEYEDPVKMLMGIEGIGEKVARSVLLTFKTFYRLSHATEKEIMECDFVGKTFANRIFTALHTEVKYHGLLQGGPQNV